MSEQVNVSTANRGFVIPLIAMFVIQAVLTGANLVLPVLAPAAAEDIGIDAGYVGIWMAALSMATMFSAVTVKRIIDRFGAVGSLQLGLACGAGGLLVIALATPLSVLCGAILLGAAYGVVNPASSVFLKKRAPANRRAVVFSVKQSGVPFGGFVVGAVVPGAMLVLGWQGAAVACALIASLLALLIWPIRDADTRQPAPKTDRPAFDLLSPIRQALRSPVLRPLGIAGGLFNGVQVSLFAYVVIYLTSGRGVSLVAAGSAYAAMQIGGVVARPLMGAIADSGVQGRLVLAVSAFLSAVLLCAIDMLVAAMPADLLFIPFAVLGAVALGWNGVLTSETASAVEDHRVAEAAGANTCFCRIGGMALPPAFGAIVMVSGSYAPAFFLTAVALALAGLVLAAPQRIRRADDADQQTGAFAWASSQRRIRKAAGLAAQGHAYAVGMDQRRAVARLPMR